MNLNRSIWHVRLFFWSLGIWSAFKDSYDSERWYENGTNFCHFMRVICVWVPLVLAAHAVLYAGAVYTVIVLPIQLFGFTPYAYVAGAITAIVLGCVFVPRWIKSARRHREVVGIERLRHDLDLDHETPKHAPKPQEPSFRKLVWMWLVSAKHKYLCPHITFVREVPHA